MLSSPAGNPDDHLSPPSRPGRQPSALVVGAGPAGATAARALARAGVPVTLLDRASFPRNKPCGGGISIRVLRRFPYLEKELSRIVTHTVSRLHLEGPDGHSTVIASEVPAALMVRRVEFDALLVSLAIEAGARLVSGAEIVQAREEPDRVIVTARDGRTFDAPVVIAADGIHSVIARRLGLNRGWPARSLALDMMEETPRQALRDVDPSTLWVALGHTASRPQPEHPGGGSERPSRQVPEGYAYVFPKRDHVNVGIGCLLSHYRETIAETPYEVQREFVNTLRARQILIGDSVRENFAPFLIPVGGPLRETARGRVLLAGDASGFVNGFTAEGIYYAMVSGDLSAQAVFRSKGSVNGLAKAYRRACDSEMGSELRDSVLIQRYLFGDRRRIARVVEGVRRNPAIVGLILDLVTGRRSYGQVRRGIFARAPLLAGRFAWELLKSAAAISV